MDRRNFLAAGAGTVALGGCTTFAGFFQPQPVTLQSRIARSTNIQIIDTGHGIRETMARKMAEAGVNTAIRYYSQRDNLAGKQLRATERDMLFDHDIAIGIVYQYLGSNKGRFSFEAGVRDATYAIERADEFGQPDGSTLFFGIDSDKHPIPEVKRYFQGIKSKIGTRFAIGIYGSGYHCDTIASDPELDVKYTWVSVSHGWRGTQKYVRSMRWSLYQNENNVKGNGYLSGYKNLITDRKTGKLLRDTPILDTNFLNPNINTIGAFLRDRIVEYAPADTQRIYDARRTPATKSGAAIYRTASLGGSPVATIGKSTSVHFVQQVSDNVAAVDTNEDGQINGYARISDFVKFEDVVGYYG